MMNDSTSWGSVDDRVGTLLCRAAFFVVEHPSPATRAELAAAREKDLVAKVGQRVVGAERSHRSGSKAGAWILFLGIIRLFKTPRNRAAKRGVLSLCVCICIYRVFPVNFAWMVLSSAPFGIGFWRKEEQSGEARCPCWKIQTEGAGARAGTSGAGRRTGEKMLFLCAAVCYGKQRLYRESDEWRRVGELFASSELCTAVCPLSSLSVCHSSPPLTCSSKPLLVLGVLVPRVAM